MAQLREYKSSVFSMLLEDPKNCLQVYNALNNTSHEDPSLVEIKRLDGGILLSIRNDASFLIDSHLNLYEHQSTYAPNMPLRSLIYFTGLIREHITNDDLFKRQKITIPVPHFVVFYNGVEARPEKEVMRLSDSYTQTVAHPDLELTCTVYNINKGYNEVLLQMCPILMEYMTFVDKVRDRLDEKNDISTAIDIAIKECISEHVLEDFLINRGNEVRQVAALDYTFERRIQLIRAEVEAEGRAEGRAEGESLALIKLICKKHKNHQSCKQITEWLEEDPALIEKLYSIISKFAPNYDAEQILETYKNS